MVGKGKNRRMPWTGLFVDESPGLVGGPPVTSWPGPPEPGSVHQPRLVGQPCPDSKRQDASVADTRHAQERPIGTAAERMVRRPFLRSPADIHRARLTDGRVPHRDGARDARISMGIQRSG